MLVLPQGKASKEKNKMNEEIKKDDHGIRSRVKAAKRIDFPLLQFPIFQPIDSVLDRKKKETPSAYEHKGTKVFIDRALTQKHLNVLASMLESDNIILSSGGVLSISESFSSFSRRLGNRSAASPAGLLELIGDMTEALIVVETAEKKRYEFHLIKAFILEEGSSGYTLKLPPEFLMMFAHDFMTQVTKERSIDHDMRRQTAILSVVRYFDTHQAEMKGSARISLDEIAVHYKRDKTRNVKHRFKEKIRKN